MWLNSSHSFISLWVQILHWKFPNSVLILNFSKCLLTIVFLLKSMSIMADKYSVIKCSNSKTLLFLSILKKFLVSTFIRFSLLNLSNFFLQISTWPINALRIENDFLQTAHENGLFVIFIVCLASVFETLQLMHIWKIKTLFRTFKKDA